MTGQVSVAAFLTARLDEDWAAAKDERVWFGPYPEDIGEFEGHLVIRDERVLREAAAKRAILALHQPRSYEGPCASEITPACVVCITDRKGYPEEWGDDDWPCATVLALAAVYSDHPDYRDEWKEQAGA